MPVLTDALIHGNGDVLGLDRVARWLDEPREIPGLHAELIPGGRSNPTYQVTDGEPSWVLRRPPMDEVHLRSIARAELKASR